MSITYEHQVHLLKDLLSNHLTDFCGTKSEYEQINRLIQSLVNNNQLEQQTKQLLKDINKYSEHGLQATNIYHHIQDHQQQLSQWINDIT